MSTEHMQTHSVSLVRAAVILGTLALVGPFAIDMYLPAMPAIATDFGASETEIQNTITTYFIAFGLAQMIYGPWADQSGRKIPVIVGLLIFIAGSVGAATSGTAAELSIWRFFQGMGGAVLMVIPRAVIRDMYTGAEATRLMALIMLVISVSPMLAPLAGSIVIGLADWRAIFYIIGLGAVASLAMTLFALPETLPKSARIRFRFSVLRSGLKTLLTDRTFMLLTFIGAFGMASFFVFIASASFVYTKQYNLTPTGFSIAFAVNAIGFFGASQLAGPMAERFGLQRVILAGVAIFAGFSALLLLVALVVPVPLYVLIGLLFVGNAGLGLVIPTTMVMALDEHGEVAGLASSLGGTLQMLTGGVMIAVAGPFFDGTALPMVAVIAICGAMALILTLVARNNRAAVT